MVAQSGQETPDAFNDRRLSHRILAALELALDQRNLDVSEHLALALEVTLTRFGGPDAKERRDVPVGFEEAFDRLWALRHETQASSASESGFRI